MGSDSRSAANESRSVSKLVDDVTSSLRDTAQQVVPWFVETMPQTYFQDTPEVDQLAHLRALLAAIASGHPPELTLRDEGGTEWTMMSPRNYPGLLATMVEQLPEDARPKAAKIHSSSDDKLVIVTFDIGERVPYDSENEAHRSARDRVVHYVEAQGIAVTAEDVEAHFHRCHADYLTTLTPLRFCRQLEYYRRVSGTESATVELEQEEAEESRIVIAVANASTRNLLERISTRLGRSGINILRAYLDVIDDGDNGDVNIMGFVVQSPEGGPIDLSSDLWEAVKKDLARLKWIDKATLELAYRHDGLSLTRAEIIMALCHLVHQVLVKSNPYGFDRDRILKYAERNFAITSSIVDLFLLRFKPAQPLGDAQFDAAAKSILERIQGEVDQEAARTVMSQIVEAVRAVERTNAFIRSRYALALRIDPKLLQTEEREELPFGVFFVHGRSFNGFHVRFRDIARGGVRAVRTIGTDQHSGEIERLYDEVYALAYAQQLKNKDIPEGGAKAVILLEPETPVGRCVKAFVDALLDTFATDPATADKVYDRIQGRRELLYLGPDENITPELIEWVVDRAARRHYPIPSALMSSKPGAGINHKVYGVTSEGVTVFLDVALRHVGIDPDKQPFTVKITGGPDGDVAGNEIRILDRDYGDNARILGIADGSGVGEDPDGLDHQELLRLFREALPIASFDRSKLGPKGRVVPVSEPEGVQLRNTLHNRLRTDAFVPAGGRPETIHGQNWRDFLQPDGQPSSRVIVEGANLFLTKEARHRLSEHGCLIVKDSSANKCGVITSSFEIAAGMLLSEDEFLEIKDTFVEQVLVKLRSLARREAELLFRMNRYHPQVPLYEFSIRLSKVAIRTADAIEESLDELAVENGKLLDGLVVAHLPRVLVEKAGDRVWNKTPKRYLRWIKAKALAVRIVYREGFEDLESMTHESITRLAEQYLRLEQERRDLGAAVLDSKIPERERIAALLDRAGILPTM